MEQILCCPNPDCHGTDLEYSEPDGATICMACHTIVEENAIVSSVEFNENNAGGASTVVGQFVGPEMTKAYSSAGRGRRRFYARDSRDTTLNNGRRAIQQVVSQLRLRQAFVDRACRLFRTAVERNFVQGRKTMCVVAVCLYMVCREDNSPHMLIDFSDAVQINVYVLGHAFLKFKQLTGLNLAVIDPSIYIHRFAARLELGSEQEQTKVSNLALRLVASMQRDWIQAGRRPSGICGAALYLAAIYHDKPRTYKDVGRIVRVSPDTIKKRVDEFEKTPVAGLLNAEQLSNMAIQEFEDLRHGVLANEADPPCYTRALQEKKMAEELRAAKENNASSSSSSSTNGKGGGGAAANGGDREGEEGQGSSRSTGNKRQKHEAAAHASTSAANGSSNEGGGAAEPEAEDADLYIELMEELLDAEEEKTKKKEEEERRKAAAAAAVSSSSSSSRGGRGAGGAAAKRGGRPVRRMTRRGAAAQAANGNGKEGDAQEEEEEEEKQGEEKEMEVIGQEKEVAQEEEEQEEEDDTAQYIRSEEEVAKLSKVWHEVHRTYLEKQERKRIEEETARKRAEEDFNYRPPTGHRKRGHGQAAHQRSMDTGQAVTNHLAKKRVSKKINYEAVKMLGADDDAEALPPEIEAMLGQNTTSAVASRNRRAAAATAAAAAAEEAERARTSIPAATTAADGGGGNSSGASEGGGGEASSTTTAPAPVTVVVPPPIPRVGEKRKAEAPPVPREGGDDEEDDNDDDDDEEEAAEGGLEADDHYEGEEYI